MPSALIEILAKESAVQTIGDNSRFGAALELLEDSLRTITAKKTGYNTDCFWIAGRPGKGSPVAIIKVDIRALKVRVVADELAYELMAALKSAGVFMGDALVAELRLMWSNHLIVGRTNEVLQKEPQPTT